MGDFSVDCWSDCLIVFCSIDPRPCCRTALRPKLQLLVSASSKQQVVKARREVFGRVVVCLQQPGGCNHNIAMVTATLG